MHAPLDCSIIQEANLKGWNCSAGVFLIAGFSCSAKIPACSGMVQFQKSLWILASSCPALVHILMGRFSLVFATRGAGSPIFWGRSITQCLSPEPQHVPMMELPCNMQSSHQAHLAAALHGQPWSCSEMYSCKLFMVSKLNTRKRGEGEILCFL